MEDRLESLRKMKALSAKYVAGEVPFVEFFPALSKLLGAFDPLESQLNGLPDVSQAEARFFSKWVGGEFGEVADLIPKNPDWRYGVDADLYSWVDQQK